MSFKVIGIGEVLWDLLPSGPQLGGAPSNFAYHAGQLGAEVQVITRVGRDDFGRKIIQRFKEVDFNVNTVQLDDQLPTGTASVLLDGGTPRFSIGENVAWDALSFSGECLEAVRTGDAICFGTLAQRSKKTAAVIQQAVMETPKAALRVFDVNLREEFYSGETLRRSLEIANVLKLNDHELAVLSAIFELKGDTRQRIVQLAQKFNLHLIALTRAEEGSLLYQLGAWSDFPGRKMDLVDTIGAGDAFSAALVMGLLHQLGLADIHRIAADIASFVCSQPGATPVLPLHLREAFLPKSAWKCAGSYSQSIADAR